MESTLKRKLRVSKMEKIFEILNIRHYNSPDIKLDEDINPNKSYWFDIVLRHPEGTNGEMLLDEAIAQISGKKFYLETEYIASRGLVLVKKHSLNEVESWCDAYDCRNKRKKIEALCGYYPLKKLRPAQ